MFRYPITITIDTNIFDSTTYDLTEDSTLRLLQGYVKDKKIKVVLSDIVVREVMAHLKRQATGMMSAIKNCRKDYLKNIKKELWLDAGAEEYIYIPKADEFANKMIDIFNQYLKDIDAEIIETADVNIQEIIDDYFRFEAPFENNERKRKEFPDAFIAGQLRSSFPELDSLVIISDDDGFKKACNKNGKYVCFRSLGDLYNAINKDSALYIKTIEMLKSHDAEINDKVTKEIKDNQNITVYGQQYDRKGIVSGHDYSETFLNSISNMAHRLHVIDGINEDEAIVTLECHCNIDMDCYYEDYDNAPWDGEKKEYLYVDTVHVIEKHQPNFACRIKINIQSGEVKVLPLPLHLGGDSRKEVFEIDDGDYDELDLLNEERDELGFQRLDRYDEYIEEHLKESDMNRDIIEALNDYHKEMSLLEDLASCCDDYIDQYNKSDESSRKVLMQKLINNLNGFKFEETDSPTSLSEEGLLSWLNNLYDEGEVYDEMEIPDEVELGNSFTISGIKDNLTFSIDNLSTSSLSEGDTEYIDIKVQTDKGDKAKGTIELTVGYLNFDDEGGAADGIQDDISFEYEAVINTINEFVNLQKLILREYDSIKDLINQSLM